MESSSNAANDIHEKSGVGDPVALESGDLNSNELPTHYRTPSSSDHEKKYGIHQYIETMDSNNIVSHDSPSNNLYTNGIVNAQNIQHNSIGSNAVESNSKERQKPSSPDTVSDSSGGSSGLELAYNEVLPREQYDRQQQLKQQLTLQHHTKLQQLLEKKRKHRKKKVRNILKTLSTDI